LTVWEEAGGGDYRKIANGRAEKKGITERGFKKSEVKPFRKRKYSGERKVEGLT